ncbi:hypothetical protein LCGC14_0498910 [marine sediment metagenome]|uniref:Phosphatidate cytidylyltransferase n=1 Tax=marine sediment metagenome TaxID=412755 RepID=A0A0F9URF3_9ZZZZ
MNILSIIIVCYFYVYALILIYISIKAKKKGEINAFINNLANALIMVIAITINLVLINFFSYLNGEFLLFPFNILLIGFIGIFLPTFYFFTTKEKNKLKKSDQEIEKLKYPLIKELPLKYEIYRKLTHLVVLGIIFFYFTLGFLIKNFFSYILDFVPSFISNIFHIGGDIMFFTQNLVIFLVGVSLIGLLTADFIRILTPDIYPLKPVNQLLRENELGMRIGPHISMSIGCFSIIILYGLVKPIGPVIICTSMTMSIFGDMASNLIGRTIGTKKIRDTNKTYEGLFAGIIVAFFTGVLILYLLRNFYVFSIYALFSIPLIGAVIIGLIDYLNLKIDDNLSYNFCISTVLFFISIFII